MWNFVTLKLSSNEFSPLIDGDGWHYLSGMVWSSGEL
jgi:hypothetical protein